MANFPPYQYQPQMMPYSQQMQPVYQTPNYQQPQQLAQEQNMFCRKATNYEEVQAFPVDFSGQPMTFHGPNLRVIWVKAFDPNTGGSVVAEYHRADPARTPQINAGDFATKSDLEQILKTLNEQAEEIARLKAPRRRVTKEVEEDPDAL